MSDEFETLASDHLEGALDDDGRRRLEARTGDAGDLARLADQIQIHHQLTLLGEREAGTDLPGRVVRELRLEGDAGRFSEAVVDRLKSGSRRSAWATWGTVAAGIGLFFVIVAFILGGGDAPPPGETAGSGGEALLIIDLLPPVAADARIAEELRALGLEVTVRPFTRLVPADLDGKALVAVSSSSTVRQILEGRREIMDLLRDAPVPVLTWEPLLFAGLGMTAGDVHRTDWAAERDQTLIVIRDPAHPLAAGLSGPVEVLSSPMQVSWGRPAGRVEAVATLADDPTRPVLFGYEAGAEMGRGTAPARRVGFFYFNQSPEFSTEDGWTLFRAAVRWCTGGRTR